MKKINLFILMFAVYSWHFCNAQNTTLASTPNGTVASMKNAIQKVNNAGHTKPRNGSQSLNNSYFKQKMGLNYVQFSVLTETRSKVYNFNNGSGFPAMLVISGIPQSAVIDTAFIYVGASYTELNAPACSISITNPASMVSTMPAVTIGTGLPVCWSETGTVAYRAGVNSSISGNGTYHVNVSGFANPDWEVDGVTLFISYIDIHAADTGTICLRDGCYATNDSNGIADTLRGIIPCSRGLSGGNAFMLAGDIQSNDGPTYTQILNNRTYRYGANFWNFSTGNTLITPAQHTFNYYLSHPTDCYYICMDGLYFQNCGDTNANQLCTNNYAQPICMVTTDTSTNKCEIIWGRNFSPPSGGYGQYNIYKDTNSQFELVYSQPLNVLSDYIDFTSFPDLGAESYKISTVDSCGESTLSAVHTSIYLTITAAPHVFILNWTPYIGFTPLKYIIYRGPALNALGPIDSVANNVLTFHDTLPPLGSWYAIEAVNPNGPCIPTNHGPSRSMFTGPISNGFNTSDFVETGTSTINKSSKISIYPNPASNSLSINLHSNIECEIYMTNVLSQKVLETKIVDGNLPQQIDISGLPNGVYFITIQSQGQVLVKKIVKL